MNRKTLTARLRGMLIGIAVCGLLLYGYMLPVLSARLFPEDGLAFWAHLTLLWLSALPCYGVLALGWRIVRNIADDRSFCGENARLLRRISTLALTDAGLMFVGNLVLIAMGKSLAMFVLLSLLVIFAGIAVAVAAAALSHLVLKAADLQEQCDLTV